MTVPRLVSTLLGALVLAAVAFPYVKKTMVRSSEASAIVDTRTVLSAEQTYASANAGFFDDVRRLCRSEPHCLGIGIPGYPSDGPEFLDPELATPSPYRKDGFERRFIPGALAADLPGWATQSLSQSSSSSSLLDFCYNSTPKTWWVRGALSLSGTSGGEVLCWPNDSGVQEIPCPSMPGPWPGAVDVGSRGEYECRERPFGYLE